MERCKGAWLHLTIILLASIIIGQISAMNANQGRYNFQGGIPTNPAEADKILATLISPRSKPPSNAGRITKYPLDPLTALEIRTAALVIRATNRTSNLLFKSIGLCEPEKALLLPYFLSGTIPRFGTIDRKANVMVVDADSQSVALVVVNLSTLKIESWTDVPPGYRAASISVDDRILAQDIAFSDPEFLQRINALGFNDLSSIYADVWDNSYIADNPYYNAAWSVVQIFFYAILGDGDNIYAHPLDFVVYIDLGAKALLGIENLPIQQDFDASNRTGNSVPRASANYFPDTMPPNSIRNDVRPIAISRPEGVSFQVQDRLVSWQNFQFRVGYTPREGLLIHQVTYMDNGNLRPLFYRLSLSEIFVYYGDPRPPYHRKYSHDEGKFLLGTSAMPMSPEFCRGKAYYYDSVVHNDGAETIVVKNTTCIFEEDVGLLWAHYDAASSRTAVTRSQRLSVSSFLSIGSCAYILSWRFYQDATIELSLRLTGIPNTNIIGVDVKAPIYGNLMAPQVYTQNFQYFIGARIDADIDGIQNTASVEDIVSVPSGSGNPYGNGIQNESTVFKTPADSITDIIPGRTWKISNPNEANPVTGKQPSWKLIPHGANMPSLLTPDSPFWEERLRWAEHNMWVLPFVDNQLVIDMGVPEWANISATVDLENTDLVLWHVFGFAYIPDPEDWPVVSNIPDTLGFKLRPSNFFTQNPAVTVPPASETTAYDDQMGWDSNSGAGWRR